MKIHYVKKKTNRKTNKENGIWPDVPAKLHIYGKYKLTSAFRLQSFYVHTLYSIKFSFYSKKYFFCNVTSE